MGPSPLYYIRRRLRVFRYLAGFPLRPTDRGHLSFAYSKYLEICKSLLVSIFALYMCFMLHVGAMTNPSGWWAAFSSTEFRQTGLSHIDFCLFTASSALVALKEVALTILLGLNININNFNHIS